MARLQPTFQQPVRFPDDPFGPVSFDCISDFFTDCYPNSVYRQPVRPRIYHKIRIHGTFALAVKDFKLFIFTNRDCVLHLRLISAITVKAAFCPLRAFLPILFCRWMYAFFCGNHVPCCAAFSWADTSLPCLSLLKKCGPLFIIYSEIGIVNMQI